MADNPPIILFTPYINNDAANALIGEFLSEAAKGTRSISLLLNSPGGDVVAGMHIYSMMRSLPVDFTTHNVGNVDSIANVVFLAGEKRRASPSSTFMFHGVGFNITNPMRADETFLRERLDSVVADHRRIGTVIAERTNLGRRSASLLFREQRTRDSTWALKNGVIHEISDPKIPSGAAVRRIS